MWLLPLQPAVAHKLQRLDNGLNARGQAAGWADKQCTRAHVEHEVAASTIQVACLSAANFITEGLKTHDKASSRGSVFSGCEMTGML